MKIGNGYRAFFLSGSWGSSILMKVGLLAVAALSMYMIGVPVDSWDHQKRVADYHERIQSLSYPRDHQDGPASRGERLTRIAEVPKPGPAPNRLDVNTGSVSQFIQLPGIGSVLADRIVTYRASHGGFQQVDELVNVSGIGPKRLQQIRQFVTVEGEIPRSGE